MQTNLITNEVGKAGGLVKIYAFQNNIFLVVTPYQPSKDQQKLLDDIWNDNISSKQKTLSKSEASEIAEERV